MEKIPITIFWIMQLPDKGLKDWSVLEVLQHKCVRFSVLVLTNEEPGGNQSTFSRSMIFIWTSQKLQCNSLTDVPLKKEL